MLLKEKKLYATARDRAVYDELVDAGVIVPHHPHKVAGRQMCTHCADGFRPHYKEWIKDLCFSQGGARSFFHTFSGNGDPMRYAYCSPLSGTHSDAWGALKVEELAETLRWARALEVSVDQMRDVHHWPCKAALDRNISLLESIDLVVRGKHRIKQQIPDLRVALELFIDWDESHHTVNLIKKEAYISYLRNTPSRISMHLSWLSYQESTKNLPVLHTYQLPYQNFG